MCFFFYGTLLDHDVRRAVRGLPASATARLTRFEGPEYRLARIEVTTEAGERLAARAFVGSGRISATPTPWNLDDWTRRHKAALLRQLRRA